MAAVTPEWLGKPESARLEYKAADALRHPETLVRAVVGFMNAGAGGTLIVGVDDQGRVDGVEDAARQRDRLQSLFLDRIDPRPAGRVDVVQASVQGREVLEVTVKRGKPGRPWAEKRSGLLGFWRREGALTIPMSRDEALQEETPTKVPRWHDGLESALGTLLVLQARSRLPDEARFDPAVVERVLDLHQRDALRFRPTGWSVVGEMPSTREPRKTFQIGARGDRRWTCVNYATGIVRFEGNETFLRWKQPPGIDEPVIYPYPLVEGTATFFLLLAELARQCRLSGPVQCELGLWRVAGWRLGPYRPGSLGWDTSPGSWKQLYPDDVLQQSRETTWQDIAENPDAEAFPLVRGVYEEFGYEEETVPFWSREEQRFRF